MIVKQMRCLHVLLSTGSVLPSNEPLNNGHIVMEAPVMSETGGTSQERILKLSKHADLPVQMTPHLFT